MGFLSLGLKVDKFRVKVWGPRSPATSTGGLRSANLVVVVPKPHHPTTQVIWP